MQPDSCEGQKGRLYFSERNLLEAVREGKIITEAELALVLDRLAFTRADRARLRELGDDMALAIETRWSGPGECDCEVCSAAAKWRSTWPEKEHTPHA